MDETNDEIIVEKEIKVLLVATAMIEDVSAATMDFWIFAVIGIYRYSQEGLEVGLGMKGGRKTIEINDEIAGIEINITDRWIMTY